jgi:sugar phosphate isomerase/epimerase
MQLVVFSKMFREYSVPELADLASAHGFDGFDLAVRPGYPVNPENAASALPQAAAHMKEQGLAIPMVTGNFDLLTVEHPTAEPILAAMDRADVRLLKLGYYRFVPEETDYWRYVGEIRSALARWEELGRRYNVKVCYHTHSGNFMGLNASSLMHLIRGFDPRYIGAYLDAGHLVANGEDFPLAAAITKEYLSIVAVKDVLSVRAERNGHGVEVRHWVPAGQGMVDWTGVFEVLEGLGYDGPVSVHCEFDVPSEGFDSAFAREVSFFRSIVPSG